MVFLRPPSPYTLTLPPSRAHFSSQNLRKNKHRERGGAAAWSWAEPALRTQLPRRGCTGLIRVPTGHLRVSSSNPCLGVIAKQGFLKHPGHRWESSVRPKGSRPPLNPHLSSKGVSTPFFLPPSFLLSFLSLPSLLLFSFFLKKKEYPFLIKIMRTHYRKQRKS